VSDFLAIGGVSATLQSLLSDRMELPDEAPVAPVSIGPPPFSPKDNEPRKEEPRINLFLYRVDQNGFLQNQEIPGRGGGGYGHPPLSLNLHYLVTAYGNAEKNTGSNGTAHFDDTIAHYLLGSAMRVLHEVPTVTNELASVRAPSGVPILHRSLRDGYERIRLSLEPLTLEDVTKVWTALALRYRLSAAYLVNVIQIESRQPASFPRPVGQPASGTVPPQPGDPPSPGPWIHSHIIHPPTITDIKVRRQGEVAELPYPYARIGDHLVLHGTALSGPGTSVAFGDLSVPGTAARPDRIEVRIPDATVQGQGAIPSSLRLQPGMRTLRVVTGGPAGRLSSMSSNDAVFMLVPAVDPDGLVLDPGPPRTLAIKGSRLIGASTGGETIVGRDAIPRTAYLSESPAEIKVPIPPTLPAQGVRVLVGNVLPDPVPIGNQAHALRIDIGQLTGNATATLPPVLPRHEVAGILASLIHDADPPRTSTVGTTPDEMRFTGARVSLCDDRLIVVSGDLTSPISITSPGTTFAEKLGLAADQPPGAASAAVSGSLPSPVRLTSPAPRFQWTVGNEDPIVVSIGRAAALEELAADLNRAINAASGVPAYAEALVTVSGDQLLFIPGAAGEVTFAAVQGDESTVVELQLRALFAVRVRVNGAESIDRASLGLPK
jgi:hypothetical protein